MSGVKPTRLMADAVLITAQPAGVNYRGTPAGKHEEVNSTEKRWKAQSGVWGCLNT